MIDKEFVENRITTENLMKRELFSAVLSDDELVIEIRPGMAFGTGAHPTTSMCLKLMERRKGRFRSFLDIGCGSGILPMAAALFGAEDILGTDIDPRAVAAAKENVTRNGFEGKVRIIENDLVKGIDFKADIITANLLAPLIVPVAEEVRKHLTPSGLFISSGITMEQLDEVRAGLKKAGFEVLDITTPGELDVDIVRKTVIKNNLNVSKFVKSVCVDNAETLGVKFQEFLKANCLSSHMMVVARKR